MELKKAIERVAKVCPRKKEFASYQAIRFLPNPNGLPYLYATDGLRYSLVNVDLDDLPNLLLPSVPLVTAAKDSGELQVIEAGYGNVEFRSGTAVYQLKGLDYSQFPGFPPMPEQFTPVAPELWAEVRKVFHAAGKENIDPEMAVINFTTDYVEATDKARFVRVDVSGPWHGIVPAATFKSWPKGEMFAAFTKTHAFFWVGEELRAAVLLNGANYPKTSKVVPEQHEGPFVLVEAQAFQEAVRQGMSLSNLGMVLLDFGSLNTGTTEAPTLTIRAWRESGSDQTYEASVPVAHGKLPIPGTAQGNMLVIGKYLDEAMKGVSTPNVRLCYGGVADPLRIESGVYVACVWQMVY